MSWLTKNLTLDLLAITIDGLTKVFDRINTEDTSDPGQAASVSAWSEAGNQQVEVPAAPAEQPAAAPAPEPAAPAQPAEQPAPEPEPDHLPQAQNLLRQISLAEGSSEWITDTLFPHFFVHSLTDVPGDKLPELIAMAEKRLTEVKA